MKKFDVTYCLVLGSITLLFATPPDQARAAVQAWSELRVDWTSLRIKEGPISPLPPYDPVIPVTLLPGGAMAYTAADWDDGFTQDWKYATGPTIPTIAAESVLGGSRGYSVVHDTWIDPSGLVEGPSSTPWSGKAIAHGSRTFNIVVHPLYNLWPLTLYVEFGWGIQLVTQAQGDRAAAAVRLYLDWNAYDSASQPIGSASTLLWSNWNSVSDGKCWSDGGAYYTDHWWSLGVPPLTYTTTLQCTLRAEAEATGSAAPEPSTLLIGSLLGGLGLAFAWWRKRKAA